jgi:hypothetical protein
MKKKIVCTIFTAVLIVSFSITGFTEEMSSANFGITTSVLSGGGAPIGSINYQTDSTLGQPSPLMDPSDPPLSSNYNLEPGFWYTLNAEPVDPCEGDITGDGFVNFADLAIMKANFFTDCSTLPPGTECVGDINNDGFCNFGDLALMKQDFFRSDCP